MFSVYGIVKLAQSTLFGDKVNTINTITVPKIKFENSGTAAPASKADPLSDPASPTRYTCPNGWQKYDNLSDKAECI
jgi:hypothetical protein